MNLISVADTVNIEFNRYVAIGYQVFCIEHIGDDTSGKTSSLTLFST